MAKRTNQPRSPSKDPGFPAWDRSGGGPADPGRRRFLKQVGVAAGGATLLSSLGLPRLAHGQSAPVDFSVLDAHPAADELAPPAPVSPAPPMAAAPTPAPAAPAQPPAEPAPPAEWITEDRALWIDPGYLVLVRWSRPVDELEPVAALEGSADAVGSYLASNVTSGRADLHDLTRLHALEAGITALLTPLVAPAVVEVLHLDHDCNAICGPAETEQEYIPLPGIVPSPDWE